MQTVSVAKRQGKAAAPSSPPAHRLSVASALALPLAFGLALAACALVPMAAANPRLRLSILGAAALIAMATAVFYLRNRRRTLAVDVQLRPQHYLQACAQSTVLLYWGWYWRPVYDALPLLAAQLAFAYAFDMLLAWSRRDSYTLGFGPFPVIFSINLFLWFKPDWFYLQFVMIAIGFAAKELIRWERDGRRAHIFNPSSFPLAVVSMALIATGNTSMTWGPEIATTQFLPPNIYLVLFLVGLPGQYLFGVTTMTMSAVLTTYLFGLAYFAATGTYFFIDSYIPVAVFLGMHLLFTDPSTSPRTELGRIIFGIVYGLGNVALYELLGRAGVPSFYDKLLPVPLMNLSVRLIDRIVRSAWVSRLDPARFGRSLAPRRRNFVYMTIWASAFAILSATDGVGDNHPGHKVPFWQRACLGNARNACETLAAILDTYCRDGSGWACNEVGVLRTHGRAGNGSRISQDFARACQLGFTMGCLNGASANPASATVRQGPPMLQDYPIVLRTGKGALPDKTPLELYSRACDQEWPAGCQSLAALYIAGKDVPRDPRKAEPAFLKACEMGHAGACSDLGYLHYSGDGVPRDTEKGLTYLKRACELGHPNACKWLEDAERSSASSGLANPAHAVSR
jgi:hypothetical protein